MDVRESGFLVHHTVKDSATQRGVYSEVTAKAMVLDNPKTAASQIAEALAVCLERMLPVYIEIPADMAEASMVPPQFNAEPNLLGSGNSTKQTHSYMTSFQMHLNRSLCMA